MNIKDYLKYIQDNESLFPIDSFPEKKEEKKKQILRTFSPEEIDKKVEDDRMWTLWKEASWS